MSEDTNVKGVAKDGKEFYHDSEAVMAYREKYPDVNLDAAIGGAMMIYEKTLDAPKDDVLEEGDVVDEA